MYPVYCLKCHLPKPTGLIIVKRLGVGVGMAQYLIVFLL